ncbi:ATPase WRNIP1 isoform X1 [Lampris incognitus]|uniref:ATPase WRNIP1 isoform X1 n=1 Tax=Lampris incognitus TaxID=2546036 RepID=UPI0024B5D718|nr:ATPase WRNIP1 isoform X1 [Lampris incognitus]
MLGQTPVESRPERASPEKVARLRGGGSRHAAAARSVLHVSKQERDRDSERPKATPDSRKTEPGRRGRRRSRAQFGERDGVGRRTSGRKAQRPADRTGRTAGREAQRPADRTGRTSGREAQRPADRTEWADDEDVKRFRVTDTAEPRQAAGRQAPAEHAGGILRSKQSGWGAHADAVSAGRPRGPVADPLGTPGMWKGVTTLAHIIASASKKKGTARFITLSATSATTSEVREIIKQAQNELRLCKRKTILFIDEIHRFNKSQQDTFLPHVECGTLTLIGATTENPSFQVNAALLSRCRVLVLEKLSVEAMSSILHRAIASLGIRVLGQDVTDPEDKDQSDAHEPKVYIEQKALDTIAHLCDGDARAGLTGLQLAVQAQVGLACPNQSAQDGPPQAVVVQEEHVKEGLQRSHILYDKAGEEHFNCISALHKSMRGSNENASLYWLGRMLEGGEDPLYVARRLVRFASEDVGLADPSALPQAVSAFQACHFIGMPECEVILAQCVVYLARAPKSVEIYKAYSNVKACLRNHKGPLPSVPLHLRNAPTKLMKDLGYAKGYKYNPNFSSTAEQEYLPEELQAVDFFTWTPSNP